MKLSTKLILFFTTAMLFVALITNALVYVSGINIASVLAGNSLQTLLSVVDMSSMEDPAEGQKVMDQIRAGTSHFSDLQIIKIDGSQTTVIAAYQTEDVGKPLSDTESATLIKKGIENKKLAGNGVGKNMKMFVPIFREGNDTVQYGGYITFSFASLHASMLNTIIGTGVTMAVLTLLITLLVGFISTRMLKRPLKKLISSANQIADGDLNIQFGKELKSKDEIGQLTRAFRNMSENLKNLIGKINDSAQQVAASAEELTAGADQTSQASRHIVDTVQQVAVGSERQVNSVEDSARVINEMSEGVHKISENAQHVSSTALFASEVAAEGNQAIHTVMNQMSSINDTVRNLHEVVKRLGARSQEIGQIVQVITDIAEQTNLLALNAAIEAARAGEHGRGFSVVADEVRKLAVQSSASGQKITKLVETIQVETQEAILSMETGTKEVSEGITVVNSAGQSFRRIQDSVNEVVEQIYFVTESVNHMSAGTEKVVESIKLIAEIAEDTAGNTQVVSASTEEQLASMTEIADASLALNQMAEELQSLVTQFKL